MTSPPPSATSSSSSSNQQAPQPALRSPSPGYVIYLLTYLPTYIHHSNSSPPRFTYLITSFIHALHTYIHTYIHRSSSSSSPGEPMCQWMEEADRLDRLTPVSFRVSITALEAIGRTASAHVAGGEEHGRMEDGR